MDSLGRFRKICVRIHDNNKARCLSIYDGERRALERMSEQAQRVAEELRQAARTPTLKAVAK
jgi:hypothetical protein